MVGNGIVPASGAADFSSCEHSLLRCGECKARDPKPVSAEQKKIAEIEEKLAAMERFLGVKHLPEGAVPPAAVEPGKPVKLDLGCGNLARRTEMKNWTRELGWTGVDIQASDGADVVCDLSVGKWPFADSSVDEVNCHHMLEHIPGKSVDYELTGYTGPFEAVMVAPDNADGVGGPTVVKLKKVITYPRAHFFNELWRVLKPGGKAQFVTPYWASCRSIGDITHEWPPVGEMSYHYLDKEWRKTQAPHDDFYTCDFPIGGCGYMPAPHLVGRTQEFVQEAIRDHKEGAGDMMVTLTCRK